MEGLKDGSAVKNLATLPVEQGLIPSTHIGLKTITPVPGHLTPLGTRPGMHVVHGRTCRENTQIHKIKLFLGRERVLE